MIAGQSSTIVSVRCDFAFKIMNFASKTKIFVLKLMSFVLKMMNWHLKGPSRGRTLLLRCGEVHERAASGACFSSDSAG